MTIMERGGQRLLRTLLMVAMLGPALPILPAASAVVAVSPATTKASGADRPDTARPVVTRLKPNHGLPGQRVTVRGRHLGGVRAVQVGRHQATVIRRSSTELTVIVPRRRVTPRSVPVRVKTTHGTSRPATYTFTGHLPRAVEEASATTNGPDVLLQWITDRHAESVVIRRSIGAAPPRTRSDGTFLTRLDRKVGEFLDTTVRPDTAYSYSLFGVGGGVPDGRFPLRVRSATSPDIDLPPGWTRRGTAVASAWRVAYDCPSDGYCVGVDLFGNYRVLRHGNWGPPTPIPDVKGALTGIHCSSASSCLAIDSESASYFFDGERWTAPVLGPSATRDDFDCGSSDMCVSAHGGSAYVWDGRGWTPGRNLSDGFRSDHTLVDCAGPSFCMVVDTYVYSWIYDGKRWHRLSSPHLDVPIESLTCASATSCRALSGSTTAVWNGVRWSRGADLPRTDLSSQGSQARLSCPTMATCLASDGNGQLFILREDRWAPVTTDLPVHEPVCSSARACLASPPSEMSARERTVLLDVDALTTAPGPSYDRQLGVSALECPTAHFCLATDPAGQYFTREHGVWRRGGAFPITEPYYYDSGEPVAANHLSCPTEDFCAAVMTAGLGAERHAQVSTYDGSSWTTPTTIPDEFLPTSAVGVTCSSPTACLAYLTDLGYGYVLSSWDGVTWSRAAPVFVPELDRLVDVGGSVSCARDGFCASIFSSLGVEERLLTRRSWLNAWGDPARGPMPDVRSVSCSSATFCMATGTGSGTAYDGSSWTEMPLFSADGYPSNVSCSSAFLCLSVKPDVVATWDGEGWTTPAPLVEVGDEFRDVACADDTCYAVTKSGRFFEYRPPT